MRLGLYNMKYPARDLLRAVLPWFRSVDPNYVSWAMIPVGVATAAVYYLAATGPAYWFAVGIGLILLRMFLGTIDGLIAVEFDRASPRGELLNRIAPELCDVMLIVALAGARPDWLWLGLAALGASWLTTFAGLVGLAVNQPIKSIGPVGQTDRLAALLLLSALAMIGSGRNWPVDMVVVFLAWCVVGGMLTVAIRLTQTWRVASGGGRADADAA